MEWRLGLMLRDKILKQLCNLRVAFKQARSYVESSMRNSGGTLEQAKASLIQVAVNADFKNIKIKQIGGRARRMQEELILCKENISLQIQDDCLKPLDDLKAKLQKTIADHDCEKRIAKEKCTKAAANVAAMQKEMDILRHTVADELEKIRGFLKGMAWNLGEKALNLEMERSKFSEECKKSQRAFQKKAETIATELAEVKKMTVQMRQSFMLDSRKCRERVEEFAKTAMHQAIARVHSEMKVILEECLSKIRKLKVEQAELHGTCASDHLELHSMLENILVNQRAVVAKISAGYACKGEMVTYRRVFNVWKKMKSAVIKYDHKNDDDGEDLSLQLGKCSEILEVGTELSLLNLNFEPERST